MTGGNEWDRIPHIGKQGGRLPYPVPGGGSVALFLGKFEHTIDDKNRVSFPARFREELESEELPMLAVFIGDDHSIRIYPKKAAEIYKANFDRKQFEANKRASAFRRLLASTASSVRPDAQGRITLTSEQKKWAGLERDVVIVGNFERIELWDPKRFETQVAAVQDADINEMANEFFDDNQT